MKLTKFALSDTSFTVAHKTPNPKEDSITYMYNWIWRSFSRKKVSPWAVQRKCTPYTVHITGHWQVWEFHSQLSKHYFFLYLFHLAIFTYVPSMNRISSEFLNRATYIWRKSYPLALKLKSLITLDFFLFNKLFVIYFINTTKKIVFSFITAYLHWRSEWRSLNHSIKLLSILRL